MTSRDDNMSDLVVEEVDQASDQDATSVDEGKLLD
jgi:hypothetical protein